MSGTATLAGTLRVSLASGYEPSIGDSFQVMTFGSRVGTLDTILGLDLGGGKMLVPTYLETGLILTVA